MRLLRDCIVAEHERGATILFSTHVMPQAEEICDHVVMIHRGRKVLDDPVSAIRRRYDPRAIVLEPLNAGADVAPVAALADVESCRALDGGYEVLLRAGTDTGRAMQQVAAAVPVARLELKRPRLEDIFVQIVKSDTGSVEAERKLLAELQGAAAGEAR
jgi:ABC-2 type transport system ATP-binding protein